MSQAKLYVFKKKIIKKEEWNRTSRLNILHFLYHSLPWQYAQDAHELRKKTYYFRSIQGKKGCLESSPLMH